MSVPETNDVWTLIMRLIADPPEHPDDQVLHFPSGLVARVGRVRGPDSKDRIWRSALSMSASSPAVSRCRVALARIQHISLRGSSPRIPARSAVSPEAGGLQRVGELLLGRPEPAVGDELERGVAVAAPDNAAHLPKILESSALLQLCCGLCLLTCFPVRKTPSAPMFSA
jgi:hypothetical protein